MVQTIATAFLLFLAYLLGVMSFFSNKQHLKKVFLKVMVISGTIAGVLTFCFMHFFIS